MNIKRAFVLIVLMVWICPAASAGERALARISKDVDSRIGAKVVRGNYGPSTENAIERPLTARSAVQTALSNNRSLQAVLESWGIAEADFNKTRLPERPTFGASVRFPREDEPYNNVEFTVEQDFLSLVLFPLKSGLAGAELHRAELQITNEVLNLAFEVKAAFYEVQGDRAALAMRKKVLEQAEASAELAQRQFDAGNINELSLATEKSLLEDARIEYMKAEADLAAKTEVLNRLMGFGGESPAWRVEDALPKIETEEPSYEELVSAAMAKRVDLLIARKNVEALRQALSLSRFGVLGHPEIGVSTEKETSGDRLTGPTVRTEVPIYDLGQTEISRSGAEVREAKLKLEALENDARSEIRQKRDLLSALRTMIREYETAVIPVREKVTQETQKHYNYMLLGNFDLIRAKQNETMARQEYIESLKNYWIARSDLEKSIGFYLPRSEEVLHD